MRSNHAGKKSLYILTTKRTTKVIRKDAKRAFSITFDFIAATFGMWITLSDIVTFLLTATGALLPQFGWDCS